MSGLVNGVAGTQIGPALTSTADDWSQSSDRMALAQMQLQGRSCTGTPCSIRARPWLTSSRLQAARCSNGAGERSTACLQRAGQLDPAQALSDQANISLPEARVASRRNEQGQPYQPSGPDGKIQVDPSTGQPVAGGPALTPAMSQILARVHAGNAYGGNMEQQGKGAVQMNEASAGNSLVPTAAASTDPNQVGLVPARDAGRPLTGALGGGNGTFSTMARAPGAI